MRVHLARLARDHFVGLLAVAALAFVASLAWALAPGPMPGDSFEGAPPPLDEAQRHIAARARADVDTLAALGERSERHYASLSATRDHIEGRLRASGLTPSRHTYTLRGRPFDNVVAQLGDGPSHLLVGAHYDSAADSPGGNDNASGVAVLLALAERLAAAPPSGAVRLVAFVNEEPPHFATERMGSRVYARDMARQGELPRAAIVLDSVGHYETRPGSQRFPSILLEWTFGNRGDFVAFISDGASEPLLRDLLGAFRERATIPSEGAVMRRSDLGASWSDHASFWAHGVPAILVTDTAAFRDARYHRDDDDGTQVDERALARLTVALETALRRLASP